MWARVLEGKVTNTFLHKQNWIDETGKEHPAASFGSAQYRKKMGIVSLEMIKPALQLFQAYTGQETQILADKVVTTYLVGDMPLGNAVLQAEGILKNAIEAVRSAMSDNPSSTKSGEYIRKAVATMKACPTSGPVFEAMEAVATARGLGGAKELYDMWKAVDQAWFLGILKLEAIEATAATDIKSATNCDEIRDAVTILDASLFEVRKGMGLVDRDEPWHREYQKGLNAGLTDEAARAKATEAYPEEE